MAGKFAGLWPIEQKILSLKELNLFKEYTKIQEASSTLRVVFALSKWPHLHRAYQVIVFSVLTVAVAQKLWNLEFSIISSSE